MAQHNIFADVTLPGMQIIRFPFGVATPLRTGQERVTLTIAEVSREHLPLPFPEQIARHLAHNRFAGLLSAYVA